MKPYSLKLLGFFSSFVVPSQAQENPKGAQRRTDLQNSSNYTIDTRANVVSMGPCNLANLWHSKDHDKAVRAVTALLDDIEKNNCDVHFLKKEDFQHIKAIRIKYKDHKRLDYADLSLVIAAEDLTLSDIITIDKTDFLKLQFNHKHHFNVIQADIEAFRKTK